MKQYKKNGKSKNIYILKKKERVENTKTKTLEKEGEKSYRSVY